MSEPLKIRYVGSSNIENPAVMRPVDYFAASALSGILSSEAWSREAGYRQAQGYVDIDEALVRKAYELGRLMAAERMKAWS